MLSDSMILEMYILSACLSALDAIAYRLPDCCFDSNALEILFLVSDIYLHTMTITAENTNLSSK